MGPRLLDRAQNDENVLYCNGVCAKEINLGFLTMIHPCEYNLVKPLKQILQPAVVTDAWFVFCWVGQGFCSWLYSDVTNLLPLR